MSTKEITIKQNTTKEQERTELHRAIWQIANDLRGSVDGWDFKTYVLGMLFYRFISENLTNYINADERRSGKKDFDYASLSDKQAEFGRSDTVKEKGFYILPSELFVNVRKNARNDANLNETLSKVFRNIENSAKGANSEDDLKGLFDDLDVNSNKLGVKRVPPFPFSINSAVDHLLKQEFDALRVKNEQHPLQKEYGIDARPVSHEELDEWRRNFGGIRYVHEPTGLIVTGAIDDLWINSNGEYIVVDYKATAKDEAVKALDKEWQDGYKRQMEVYQWLLRRNGLKVSSTGYFVYCTGKMDREAFDKRIDFDVNLIEYVGNDSWVEGTLLKIKECLDSEKIPATGHDCDWCNYWNARRGFES